MIDFKKLNDPKWQAQVRKEREEREAKAEAHEKMLRRELNLCLEADETLAQNERSLVRNCQHRLNTGALLSEPQEKWLLDIAKRVRTVLAEKVKALVSRHANGDTQGQHPAYPRSDWPLAKEAGVDPADYWFWVLRLVDVFGDEASA
ncbi:hypothetical protein WJ96_05735 [Burkholderia ubonensis]|uniref:Uncharacterized protein n=1 Tax=Burkholderia ubonensis TaxID=101571 RepID=A0AAW3MYK0_9BURK|nr:hypothetical protein [Burkholderia ubonensis]KVP75257.1 hypothetical protein WJ93_07530 [Burkholderia ubonensis]KVP96726.1 hypothetical protein WJ97_12665 [Burkholderia ubonensis]KVP98070.1 hypothetical protein WJ96_05735 [Burkholderia ubonensis]KVZ92767.1 hypothetical protein WL25_17395 [Burkholderia ubonensis]